MSKKIAMIVCMVISLCMLVTVFASSSFNDIKGTKYEMAVNKLKEEGVIDGMEDGSFRTYGDVTRAQLAKMTVTAFELKGNADVEFDDFDKKYWAADYIEKAVKNGVIRGYNDNTFKPENKVTYGEATTMLIRAYGKDSASLKNGKWPDAYMNKAEELNMFKNVSSYKADDIASRGDIALMIYNLTEANVVEIPFEEVKDGEIDIPKLGEKITNMGIGDINVDGSIDKKDVLELSLYLKGKAELSKEGLENADLNADMKIDEKDLDILQRYLAGTINILPYTAENGELPIPLYPDPVKKEKDDVKNEITIIKEKDKIEKVEEVTKTEVTVPKKETTTKDLKDSKLKLDKKVDSNMKDIEKEDLKIEIKEPIKRKPDVELPVQPKPTLVTK